MPFGFGFGCGVGVCMGFRLSPSSARRFAVLDRCRKGLTPVETRPFTGRIELSRDVCEPVRITIPEVVPVHFDDVGGTADLVDTGDDM